LKHFNLLIAPPPERHQAPAIINHRLPSVQTQSPTFIQSPLSLNHQLPGIIIFSAVATNFNTVYHYPDRCPSVALLSVSRQLSPFDHGPPRLHADAICSLDDSLNQSVSRITHLRLSASTPRPFIANSEICSFQAFKMKYLPVQDFEAVTSTLNFNTPDCNVTGGCDLYTTKASGSDKKLYKNIDNDLNSQHEALLKLGASLSPPERAHMLATSPSMQMFSHSSAFGPLSELSSRKTFAYLIATLNASHPHYDFSHVLRPNDFKRERNLRRVMINLDSILQNVRPNFEPKSLGSSLGSETTSIWGPQCWSLIDKEMHLNECTIFSYHPDSDPFEEDESAIWASHYFFFNRTLKRVAYLYVRVVPVISSHSPTLRPTNLARNHSNQQLESAGAQKRANYWLGDQNAELVPFHEDDEELNDDGLFWNRGENGDLVAYSDDEFEDDIDDMDMLDRSPDRFMSEDIAGRMEI
jgi:AP-1 complex subunit sigma 1/2